MAEQEWTAPPNLTDDEIPTGPANDKKPVGAVLEKLFSEGYQFDFFQAVWLLENLFSGGQENGISGGINPGRLRIRPHSGLVFPATDIKSIEQLESDPSKARITVTFMGLYGIDSPLPVYFYDDIATEAERTFSLRDFLDIFNHRLYTLFYGAWKKYQPQLHFRNTADDAFSIRHLSLAGLGTPNIPERDSFSLLELTRFAGRLSSTVKNVEGLENLLLEFLNGIQVHILENIPRWVKMPYRPRLGSTQEDSIVLSDTALLGNLLFDLSGRFRIVLGPMGLSSFLSFLPENEGAEKLFYLVRLYAPDYLDFDVELKLDASEIPKISLGAGDARLGLNTWLGKPESDVISQVVEYS